MRGAFFCGLLALLTGGSLMAEENFQVTLRSRVPSEQHSVYRPVWKEESWQPRETAFIVCDMWDAHHCLNAVRRGEELAPRMNAVLQAARGRGALIIHAPSSCTGHYKDHPAWANARAVTLAKNLPAEIGVWCHRIPAEEAVKYPIDQSDGGEDDDPEEHKAWHEKLAAMGRNPKAPWIKQTDLIDIENQDFITDNGEVIWSLLEQRGIRNVVLLGVHTNMCVLGRPFGLRQMAKNGKHVVLMRDMTDTMYNPQRAPFVSHFSGTDLIVEHIERVVCPTITSDQIVGGQPFVFKNDQRPHIAVMVAEKEYDATRTLPAFAERHLRKDFRISYIFQDAENEHRLQGLSALDDADALLMYVWRRMLPAEQLQRIRKFIASGKPVIALRTSSHAFVNRPAWEIPAGHAVWPEFDREILGCRYEGHYGGEASDSATKLTYSDESLPILQGVDTAPHGVPSWLYKVSPLHPDAQLLIIGQTSDGQRQPVAWTLERADKGRTFYTSLGHAKEFEQKNFQRLLTNAVYWATGVKRE